MDDYRRILLLRKHEALKKQLSQAKENKNQLEAQECNEQLKRIEQELLDSADEFIQVIH